MLFLVILGLIILFMAACLILHSGNSGGQKMPSGTKPATSTSSLPPASPRTPSNTYPVAPSGLGSVAPPLSHNPLATAIKGD